MSFAFYAGCWEGRCLHSFWRKGTGIGEDRKDRIEGGQLRVRVSSIVQKYTLMLLPCEAVDAR